MSTVILHSSRGDGELRIDPTDTPGILDVSVGIGGLHARTRVDATNAASSGWQSTSSVLVTSPELSLDDLCDHLLSNREGWYAEETWESRDGHLQLGFTHREDHICIAVTVKNHGQDGWVISTHVDIAHRDVNSMVSRLREVATPVAV